MDYIIIHCSATREGRPFTVTDIDRWHRAQGWNGCGYHYVITLDGRIQSGRPLWKRGAHCRGYNAGSIGICYIGGLSADGKPKDTRTPQQKEALRRVLLTLRQRYPEACIVSHHTLNPGKACPCFDAETEYADI